MCYGTKNVPQPSWNVQWLNNILVGSQPATTGLDFDGAVIESNAIDGSGIPVEISGSPANVYVDNNQEATSRLLAKILAGSQGGG